MSAGCHWLIHLTRKKVHFTLNVFIVFSYILFIYFWLCHAAWGVCYPIKPRLTTQSNLPWKHRFLTTGLPGKSPFIYFKTKKKKKKIFFKLRYNWPTTLCEFKVYNVIFAWLDTFIYHVFILYTYTHTHLYMSIIYICIYTVGALGFPSGSDGKESTCNAGDLSLIPRSGRSSGEGNGSSL